MSTGPDIYTLFIYDPGGRVYFRGAFSDLYSAISAAERSQALSASIAVAIGDGELPPDELSHMSLHRGAETGPIVWSRRYTIPSWGRVPTTPVNSYLAIRKTPLDGSPLHALAEQAEALDE